MFDKVIYKRKGIVYSVLSFLYFIPFRFFFYRKTVIKGLENIPKGKPILFAPNHQNAMMDPLAVTFTSIMPMSYLTRSDVFKNKYVSAFLQKIKMLPVYRIRDGAEKLKLNEEVFKFSVTVLENKMPMVIFPEASHTDKRCLQTLKKGVPRLVFQAEEDNDWNLDLHVVPVGLYYDDYAGFRSVLQVIYGKAIRVADFKSDYLKNKAKGLNALREAMADELKPIIINIESKEHYDTYEILRNMYAPLVSKKLGHDRFNQYNKFIADKHIIDKVSAYEKEQIDEMNVLSQEVNDYNSTLLKLGINDDLLMKGNTLSGILLKILILIVGFPVFIYGAVNNALPTWITLRPIKKVKDPQFHSTIKYVLGSIVYFVTHIIFAVIFGFVFNLGWALLYFFTLTPSGILAFHYMKLFSSLKTDFHFKQISTGDEFSQLVAKRKIITEKLEAILTNL